MLQRKAHLRQFGYSLVELLVVIAIASISLGLLLSAIQKTRQSVSRIECLQRLSQVAMATQMFHDNNGRFPTGLHGDNPNSRTPFMTWNVQLLPYLDQEPLWRDIQIAYVRDRSFLNTPPHIHRATVVRFFSCPADSRTLQPSTVLGSFSVAFTSYLGVSGINLHSKDGVLFMNSAIRLAEITDGASYTLLIGERPPSADQRFGWWYAGWGQSREGSVDVVMGVNEINVSDDNCSRGPYRFGLGAVDNQCDCYHYWSLHSGGGNFLFSDGSCRFLAYSVYTVFPAFASRSGGEVVSD